MTYLEEVCEFGVTIWNMRLIGLKGRHDLTKSGEGLVNGSLNSESSTARIKKSNTNTTVLPTVSLYHTMMASNKTIKMISITSRSISSSIFWTVGSPFLKEAAILPASTSCCPVTCDRPTRSEPARSTSVRRDRTRLFVTLLWPSTQTCGGGGE